VKATVGILLAVLALTACGPRGGDPGALMGTWRSDAPPATLQLGVHSFRFQSGELTKWGTVERTPFRVAFVLERPALPRSTSTVETPWTCTTGDWRMGS
jgi:hypothetical protein